MSDMWAAASKDIEAERRQEGAASAAVALGGFSPFLFEAKSLKDFNTRVALQQEKIAAALVEATDIPEARKDALDQMQADFKSALSTRRAEANKATKTAQAPRRTKTSSSEALFSRLGDLNPRRTISGDIAIKQSDDADVVVYVNSNSFAISLEAYDGSGGVTEEKELGQVPISQPAKAEKIIRAALGRQGRIEDRAEREINAFRTRKLAASQEEQSLMGLLSDFHVQSTGSGFSASIDPSADASVRWVDGTFRGVVKFNSPNGSQWKTQKIEETDPYSMAAVLRDVLTTAADDAERRRQSRQASRRTAASEIAAGDFIASKSGPLPDLRDGRSNVTLTEASPGKVVKVQNLEHTFERKGDRYGVIDAADRFEDWLGQDIPGRSIDGNTSKAWVAVLDSGAIVPLDAEGTYSHKFPTRVSEPAMPGQQSFSFSSRRPRTYYKAARQEALSNRRTYEAAGTNSNPYSQGNPYGQQKAQPDPQPADPGAPQPQVTVNVAPSENENQQKVEDDDERQRRARDQINQTQMTQDLTASVRNELRRTMARKIMQENPGIDHTRALKVAEATMDRFPALVRQATNRARGRDSRTQESSPR